MIRSLSLALALALGLAASSGAGEPVQVDLTTKLGVEAKVLGEVHPDFATALDSEHGYGALFRDFVFAPKRGAGGLGLPATHYLCLQVDQGLILMIPLDQIKTVTAKAKQHVVALADRTELEGKVLNTVKDKESGKSYRLQDVKSASFAKAPATATHKPEDARYACTVGALGKKTFDLVKYHFSPHPARSENTLKVKVEGEEIEANLSDFETVAIAKDKKGFKVTLTTPNRAQTAGEYGQTFAVVGEAVNGWVVVQFSGAGFTALEVTRKAAKQPK